MIVSIFWLENNVVCLFYQLTSAGSSTLSAVHCQYYNQAQDDNSNNANNYVDDLQDKTSQYIKVCSTFSIKVI